MTTLHAINTALPEYCYLQEELLIFYRNWIALQDSSLQQKAQKIFVSAGIKKKFAVLPIDEIFAKRDLNISNALYKEKAVEYGCKLVKESLKNFAIDAKEIDFLITTSCTGWMIPSINSYLIDQCGLREDITHIPITQYGCAGGVAALNLADKFLKSKKNSKALIFNLEFSTNTMQSMDFSLDNIVSVALFSDGISCAIVDSSDLAGLYIIDSSMKQLSDTQHILGYDLTNSGFKMTLSKELPAIIKQNFENVVTDFLEKNSLQITDIDRILVHPGGIKILENIEILIKKYGKNLSLSKKVLENYGNMSSATVMFILQELLREEIKCDEKILLIAFGPGFCIHQILFNYET